MNIIKVGVSRVFSGRRGWSIAEGKEWNHHAIVFVWSDGKGRQQNQGPFGAIIKICWSSNWLYNICKCTMILSVKLTVYPEASYQFITSVAALLLDRNYLWITKILYLLWQNKILFFIEVWTKDLQILKQMS